MLFLCLLPLMEAECEDKPETLLPSAGLVLIAASAANGEDVSFPVIRRYESNFSNHSGPQLLHRFIDHPPLLSAKPMMPQL
jgi:hypothetical protein